MSRLNKSKWKDNRSMIGTQFGIYVGMIGTVW